MPGRTRFTLGRVVASLAALAALVLGGCGHGYHDYAGSCVPYRYCPPRPLPHISYDGCHCPMPTESAAEEITRTDVIQEAQNKTPPYPPW